MFSNSAIGPFRLTSDMINLKTNFNQLQIPIHVYELIDPVLTRNKSKHLKGHLAPRVSNVTFLLKGHSGPSVSCDVFAVRSFWAKRQKRDVFAERSFWAKRQ